MKTEYSEWMSLLSGFGSKQMDEIGVLPFTGVMLVSLFSALFISVLYTRFYSPRSTGSMIHKAFPLLGMSITAIFIAIQFSLPLSLGLLGALSIVRFRNPVKEPEEIGFIMLVVATSLCCATFNMLFLAIIHAVALFALIVLRYGHALLSLEQNEGVLIVELPGSNQNYGLQVIEVIENSIKNCRLESLIEQTEKSAVTFNFRSITNEQLKQVKEALVQVHPEIRVDFFRNQTQVV